MDILNWGVGLAAIVCFLYMIARQTGFEGKLRRVKAQNLKQLESGWGVDETIRLTEVQAKSYLKMGEKVNKNVICGTNSLGKMTKCVKLANTNNENKDDTTLTLCEIKKGIRAKIGISNPIYLILRKGEISHVAGKTIYLKDKIFNNLHGVYYFVDDTKDNLKNKIDVIKLMLEIVNYEDVTGRVCNLATKVAYLDITHAERVDSLRETAKVLSADMARRNPPSAVDMLAA